jgi:serine/threonine-protein kinase HipA
MIFGYAGINMPIAHLVDLANVALVRQEALIAEGVEEILRVGSSAGGGRAKAVVAWNAETGK